MLVTLIPLFDKEMSVRAYSLFTQKNNYFLNPILQGSGTYDGAAHIPGLEVIESMGIETLSADKEVFVPINNISIFTDIEVQCKAPHMIDNTIVPEEMYIDRVRELKKSGFKFAIRKLAVAQFEQYREILLQMDYVLLDHKKIDITKAKIYFSKIYPNVKLCAGNIQTQEIYDELKEDGGYEFYEGEAVKGVNIKSLKNGKYS